MTLRIMNLLTSLSFAANQHLSRKPRAELVSLGDTIYHGNWSAGLANVCITYWQYAKFSTSSWSQVWLKQRKSILLNFDVSIRAKGCDVDLMSYVSICVDIFMV